MTLDTMQKLARERAERKNQASALWAPSELSARADAADTRAVQRAMARAQWCPVLAAHVEVLQAYPPRPAPTRIPGPGTKRGIPIPEPKSDGPAHDGTVPTPRPWTEYLSVAIIVLLIVVPLWWLIVRAA